MEADRPRTPLEEHDVFAISVEKAAEAGGVGAADTLLTLIERSKALLKDVKERKIEFPPTSNTSQHPNPLPEARVLLEKRSADMAKLWAAADRLPQTLPEMPWVVPMGLNETVRSQTAQERIQEVWRRILNYIEIHAEWQKRNGGDGFTAIPHDQHAVWGLLDKMDDVVRTKYAVELAVRHAQIATASVAQTPQSKLRFAKRQAHHISRDKVAKMLGVTDSAVSQMVRSRRLPAFKDPDTNELLFDPTEVAKFISANPRYTGRHSPVRRTDLSDEDASQQKADWNDSGKDEE